MADRENLLYANDKWISASDCVIKINQNGEKGSAIERSLKRLELGLKMGPLFRMSGGKLYKEGVCKFHFKVHKILV